MTAFHPSRTFKLSHLSHFVCPLPRPQKPYRFAALEYIEKQSQCFAVRAFELDS